jgi:hypothetical protein
MSAIQIRPQERAVIGPELDAFVGSLPPGEVRDGYAALRGGIAAGEVPADEVERLAAFLELAISTGRISSRHGQHGEDQARRVFERTPRGAAQATSADQITRALGGLVGQTIKDLKLTTTRPGSYRMVLETEQYRISLAFAPAGAHVESVEVTL